LTSAVRTLNLIAVCPARRSQALEIFLFSAGRLLEQREVDRAVLEQIRPRRTLVAELLSRYQGSRATAGSLVEQEVVDQINIVSEWLRRRSGEGRHLVLDERPPGSGFEREVERWLGEAAVQVVGGPGATRSTSAAPRASAG
jgi:hypothetical protein